MELAALHRFASLVMDAATLADWLVIHGSASRYWIGYSGGLDSYVLLHLSARLGQTAGRFCFAAVHIHHGLQPTAEAWAEHCAEVCAQLGVPFHLMRVDAKPQSGQSPEEAARNARYRAFEDLLGKDEALLTAQHADDQAETVLLQLLRGAGLAGLAAMPEAMPLGRGVLLRPLLGWSRDALQQYAINHGLRWVEDPSNRDTAYDRNFIRHQIMPLLAGRWPGVAATLGRTARHCAEAQGQLNRLADDLLLAAGDNDIDAATSTNSGLALAATSLPSTLSTNTVDLSAASAPSLRQGMPNPMDRDVTRRPYAPAMDADSPCRHDDSLLLKSAALTLSVTRLRQWRAPEQRLVLRHWLKNQGFRAPSAAVLQRIIAEALFAAGDRNPRVAWCEGEVRRHRDRLYALRPLPELDTTAVYAWDGRQPLLLPGNGLLEAGEGQGPGIRSEYLDGALEVRYRRGGERCRLLGRAGSHALKKLFQETQQVPPWVRERMPLLYIDGQLAAVGDLWVCLAFAGGNITLRWSGHGLWRSIIKPA